MAFNLSKIGWYWHRLLAMNPREIGLRVRKKWRARQDRNWRPPAQIDLESRGVFPRLPSKSAAPSELLDALRRDAPEILAGRWKFFGHMPLKVDDPPKWQFDYFVRQDFTSTKSGFHLDHRAQPGGADIKVIWEPSRWYQLVRLAMAAWLLDDQRAAQKCVQWLQDWCDKNPPFTGLNWTSGLETGIRLVQYTWIDALLAAAGVPRSTLQKLSAAILPAHIWYTSRHRSFGSSANNHLIGELAGLILAVARWPDAARFTDPLPDLAKEFEREVLLQFGADGGNLEQGLGYHLFSWEFCWQAMVALRHSGIEISPRVAQRLAAAGEFYRAIKPCGDPWEYGDSDNAYVTPLFANETQAGSEWWRWFDQSASSPALAYWWGNFSGARKPAAGWHFFEDSGHATFRSGDWFLRWDLSPLGYPKMAPHGHLDALHVSIWFRGEPVIIDPGTGTYYAEKEIRQHLADWAAHNGPHLLGEPFPKRRGMFLWGEQHARPKFTCLSGGAAEASLTLPNAAFIRKITFLEPNRGFQIQDSFKAPEGVLAVTHWKFAPDALLNTSPLTLQTAGARFKLSLRGWTEMDKYQPAENLRGKTAYNRADLSRLAGNLKDSQIISPAFRALTVGPSIQLGSPPGVSPLEFSITVDE